jgi:hypothetical protein
VAAPVSNPRNRAKHLYLWNNEVMKRPFAAAVWRGLEPDAASQGEEAIEPHLAPPQATRPPEVRTIEVEVGAA